MYQEWGNTDFSFGLGTSNTEPVDDNGNPVTKHPNYSYCNGFHCGIDQFAAEGTFVRAGISGQVVFIADWNAYSPRYIVIRIGRDLYMRVAHLDASDTAPVEVGDSVTSKTIVGKVADYFGGANNHVHIEFFTGGVGNEGDYLNPHQFMTTEFNDIMSQNRINANGMNFHQRSDGLYGSLTTQPSEILNRQQNFNANEPGYTIPHGWIGHEH